MRCFPPAFFRRPALLPRHRLALEPLEPRLLLSGESLPDPTETIGPLYCPDTGHYYEMLYFQDVSYLDWETARSTAVARSHAGWSGHLATITSQSEQNFITNDVMAGSAVKPRAWLGARQATGSSEPGDGWAWITEEPWGYTNWGELQPDDGSADASEQCLELLSANGDWNDGGGRGRWVRGMLVEYEQAADAPDLTVISGARREVHTDAFGSVPVGNTATRALTLLNTGVRDLVIHGAAGLDAPFVLVSSGEDGEPSGWVIPPGESRTLALSFHPASAHDFTGTLTLTTNDPNETEYAISLTGSGGAPRHFEMNGHSYEWIHIPEGITWDEAVLDAALRSFGGVAGHLATLTTSEENAFITEHIVSQCPNRIWIGGHQPANGASFSAPWAWVTGETWSYTNWEGVQPDNCDYAEDVLVLYGQPYALPQGRWNDDWRGERAIRDYIVEYDGEVGSEHILYCPDNGHYYRLSEASEDITWDEARKAAASQSCLGLSGHLATITSAAESAFIVERFVPEASQCIWLGGHQSAGSASADTGWRWITGEAWSFTNWTSGEPNNPIAGANALGLRGDLGGTWNDSRKQKCALLPGRVRWIRHRGRNGPCGRTGTAHRALHRRRRLQGHGHVDRTRRCGSVFLRRRDLNGTDGRSLAGDRRRTGAR